MNNIFTESVVSEVLEKAGLKVVERVELSGKDADFLPVPSLLHSSVKRFLAGKYPDGLYAHQAKAIEESLAGKDICLSTSTASGKSLVFMSVAAHVLKNNPSSKVLALYPARALIQDQWGKWKELLDPLALKCSFIHGDVPVPNRPAILRDNQIILMTPDVAHAWLMSHLNDPHVKSFLRNIRLLVLDEAHAYEGVFGTNMAYFLRRFNVAAKPHQLICSSATIGYPTDFIHQLTGREVVSFGMDSDASKTPKKTILLVECSRDRLFDSNVTLLKNLAQLPESRFLAFADSRRMVEQLVAAIRRKPDDSSDEAEGFEEEPKEVPQASILPYRAGYEDEDRDNIQSSLQIGLLSGVVSTSAMELGIDIGDIDLVALLSLPPTLKSFWQRLGRTGRQHPGVCIVVDNRGIFSGDPNSFKNYLEGELEPSSLYLDNKYIQYTNALCAKAELEQLGIHTQPGTQFRSLPENFQNLLANEIEQTEQIPNDLLMLRQRAQEKGAHYEFPIRTGIEKGFRVKGTWDSNLGSLTLPQLLLEGYPGAIYYYMGIPHRVYHFNYRSGEIRVKRTRFYTTRPLKQTMVFPNFQEKPLKLLCSKSGFIAEAEMQVSDRVIGFVEARGGNKFDVRYGPDCEYYKKELNRFFETSGVCWYFDDPDVTSSDMAEWILEAFCVHCGIQARDIGDGVFFSRQSPLGNGKCEGVCIFDATHGSLRITEQLAANFPAVLQTALVIADSGGDQHAVASIKKFITLVNELSEQPLSDSDMVTQDTPVTDDWVAVVASGEKAMKVTVNGSMEVEIKSCRYTPSGLMYEIVDQNNPRGQTFAPEKTIQPIYGETKMARYNPYTGEIQS